MELKAGIRVMHRTSGTQATLIRKMSGLNAWAVRLHDGESTNWWAKNIMFLPRTNEEAIIVLHKDH